MNFLTRDKLTTQGQHGLCLSVSISLFIGILVPVNTSDKVPIVCLLSSTKENLLLEDTAPFLLPRAFKL